MHLSHENQCWLDDFRERHGRSPRILHIGNIANNAYNNARLLNEAGLDCDVVCYDYYHVMGCPEWEDADFTARIEDDFFPEWRNIDLKGFVRPPWFAQGPLELCLQYLMSRRTGHHDAPLLWNDLLLAARCIKPSGLQRLNSRRAFYSRPFRTIRRLMTEDVSIAISKVVQYLDGKFEGNAKLAALCLLLPLLFTARVFASPVIILWRKWRLRSRQGRQSVRSRNVWPTIDSLVERWEHEFPDRRDAFVSDDIVRSYLCRRELWSRTLSCYDYVIGYSTDPIIPLVCGVPYFALEHGTIREIPYQKTSQGRLTALAYRLADHVFVTNFDCVGSAEILARGNFTIINHPYDEDHGLKVADWIALRTELLADLNSEFLFFHPTRQDWVEGTGYADKNNDVFLLAFAEMRSKGIKVGLVCCSWGSNVRESKALLTELGCSENVRWVAPLAITPFERMCLATDMVVDQFKLGAFGGIVFKAMAVGTPILTYLDELRLARQYPECPPVVNCRTAEEIVAKMRSLIASPAEIEEMGNASRAWMKRYHAKEITVNAQVDQFRRHPPISEACATVQ